MTKMASRMECTVVVVGDAKVGKTALINKWTKDQFSEAYAPTGFDKVTAAQEVNKHKIDFVLWDTSGSPAYDSVRSLSYQEADVFLVCYKTSDPASLCNAKAKWTPEIRRHRPEVPIILCGCQADLRSDAAVLAQLSKTGRSPVSPDQALAICCEMGAVNYVETSAKWASSADRDVSEVFELCALAAIKSSIGSSKIGAFKRSISSSFNHSSSSSIASQSSSSALQKSKAKGKPSGVNNNVINVSFESNKSESNLNLSGSKRASLSVSSSLQKSCNISFSGSECEVAAVAGSVPPILEDEGSDIFPGFDSSVERSRSCKVTARTRAHAPLSPLLGNRSAALLPSVSSANSRSSAGHIRPAPDDDSRSCASSDLPLSFAEGPLCTSTTKPSNLRNTPSAQVRANGLSRRTSFRSPLSPSQPPVAVVSPRSPLGSVSSAELIRSPLFDDVASHSHPRLLAPVDLKPASAAPKGFESFKSAGSTGSAGSTASKTSTGSSCLTAASDDVAGCLGPAPKSALRATASSAHILDPDLPDTEDPELLRHLNFVSPKSGVFRPVNSGLGHQRSSGGKKQSCSVM